MSAPVPQTEPAFSVLLPVYAGDQAPFFRRAIASVTADQTRPPNELVIVVDGPVDADIEAVLTEVSTAADPAAGEAASAAAGTPTHPLAGTVGVSTAVVLVRLPTNQGLALALNAGLQACRYDIVARADADDISLPERFARQIPLLEGGYDIVGAAIQEFDHDEHQPDLIRPLPTTAAELDRFARFRSPFHHPAVVYRKSVVLAAGGYEALDQMEDYLLWSRLLSRGARAANLPQVLVLYRVGAGAYSRRGGRRLTRSEWRLQRTFRREGFTTRAQFLRNLCRLVYRLLPVGTRKPLYGLLNRPRTGRHG